MRSKKSGRCLMALTLSVVMLFPAPMSYAAEKGEGMEEVGTEADAVNLEPDENGFVIEDGELTGYQGTAAEIVIPDSVTSIGRSAFEDCSGLTSVTIPNSVTGIGYRAFRGCSGLTSVTIPDSVKSIDGFAFFDCSGLTSVVIPDGVKRIRLSTFSGCSGLTSVTIPDSVTMIENGAFRGCSGLTSVTIPDGVTKIGQIAFEDCSGLTSVSIPDGVTNIESRVFEGCSGLTSAIIPDSVTSIETHAFRGCSGLTSVTIPDSVESIGRSAFIECSGLTSIKVETGNTTYDSRENCNAIIETENNRLIAGCKTTLIPGSVTSIGESAFYGCSGLTSVSIPDSVTSIRESAFDSCSGLTSVSIPDSVKYIGGYAFCGCIGLTSVTFPDGMNIGEYAFRDCIGLTSVSIPDNATEIGDGAFLGCIGLTSVSIPDSVKYIGDYAFEDCNEELVVYGKAGSHAETYAKENNIKFSTGEPVEKKELSDKDVTLSQTSYTYDGTAKMPGVTVKYANSSLTKDVDYTVVYQDNINVGTARVTVTGIGNYTGTVTKTFTIAKGDSQKPGVPNVKELSKCTITLSKTAYTYDGTAKKPAVTVKDGATILKAGTDYTVAYRDNKNAGKAKAVITGKGNYKGTVTKTFTITVKKGESHRAGAYQYEVTGASTVSMTGLTDKKITKVKVPNTVKIGGKSFRVTAIGNGAFEKNKKITSVETGNKVKTIGTSAFEDCTKLSRAAIGTGVTQIGGNAFKNCKKLGTITIKSTKLKKVGRNALKGIKPVSKIKVPAKKLSAYKKLFENKGQGVKVKIVK